MNTNVYIIVLFCCMTYLELSSGFSIAEDFAEEDVAEKVDDSDVNYIHFERSINDKSKVESLLKRLEIFLQKPLQKWTTPNKLSSHPSSCDQLTYCERETRPPPGTFRRLPIHPWWYYSCEGTKVNCKPCPTTGDLDQPTLFFSERCQQCISEYKDEKITCPSTTRQNEDTHWWTSIFQRR